MHVRKLALSAIIAILVLLAVAVCSLGAADMGVANAAAVNPAAVTVTLGGTQYADFAQAGGHSTGVVFEVDESVTDIADTTGSECTAVLEYSRSATIALTGDLLRAVKSSRLSASLMVDGGLTLGIPDGNFSRASLNVSVSGALSGRLVKTYAIGDFATRTHTEAFDMREVVAQSVLTADGDASEIVIDFAFTVAARNISYVEDSATARVTAEGDLEYYLTMSFEEVSYSVSVDGNGRVKLGDGSIVDDTTTVIAGFGDVVSYEAIPTDAHYFANWTGSATRTERKIDLGAAVSVPRGTTYNYIAHYALISVENGDIGTFDYKGYEEGPIVSDNYIVSLYHPVHSYSGTRANGTAYDSDLRPTDAGTYNYHCYLYRDAERNDLIGQVSRSFSITRIAPVVTLNAAQTLSYGATAEFIDLTHQITGAMAEKPEVSVELQTSAGIEVTEADKQKILPSGLNVFRLKVMPEGAATLNYKETYAELNVTIQDNLVVTGTELNSAVGRVISTESKSVVNSFAPESGVTDNSAELTARGYVAGMELIKVRLGVTLGSEVTRYFFLGWQVGIYDEDSGVYNYKYYTAGSDGYDFIYYIPSSRDLAEDEIYKYTHLRFEAIFVKDRTAGDTDELVFRYTGISQASSADFSLSTSTYRFGPGEIRYSKYGTGIQNINAPYEIGEHKMTYTVNNNELGVTVGTREITYKIIVANVATTVLTQESIINGGYSEAYGWARNMYYRLSVSGLKSNGAQGYYYSTDNGSTWTAVSGTPASNSGLNFTTPDIADNTSGIINIIFVAIGDDGIEENIGGVNRKVIARSAAPVTAKIDNYTPQILAVDYADGYSDAWSTGEVRFVATVRYGASGAVLRYTANDSDYIQITSIIDGAMGYKSGTDIDSTESTVTFAVNPSALNADIKFQIRSAVGRNHVYTTDSFRVRIDGIAPVITLREGTDTLINANGWYKDPTTVSLNITDEGGSGLKEYYEESGTLTIRAEANGTYSITLTDSEEYYIIAKDNAGHTIEFRLQLNVDVVDITYEYASGSYVSGTWTNEEATIAYVVSAGGSGLRMSYSVDGGNTYRHCNGAEYVFPVGGVMSYTIPVREGINSYKFRIENAAGKMVVTDFADARFDVVAPVVNMLTDLTRYQSGWYHTPITAEFTLSDDGGSGLNTEVLADNKGVVTYDAGRRVYGLTIDKCTPYAIAVRDNAGNVTLKVLQANIDTVTPELTIRAYVGGGNPNDTSVEPTGNYDEYNFLDWITRSNDEPWIRFEFTINLTASGSRLQYSNNNGATWRALTEEFMPEDGEITGTVTTRAYITEEQNKPYIFRLMTGSGAEYRYYPLGEGTAAYVRIDFTPPVVEYEDFSIGDRHNVPLKTEWSAENVNWWISIADSAGGNGSGVDTSTIKLTEYAVSTSDSDIVVGTATGGVDCTLVNDGSYYAYTFTEYKKYYLTFADKAGNQYVGQIFSSHIDTTSGFGANFSAKKVTEGEDGEYVAGEWLSANQIIAFAATATGIEAFGPSGAALEASIDGGNTWMAVSTEASGLAFEYLATEEQYATYRFRIVTGAGVAAYVSGEYTVYKDNATLGITASVTYADGSAYGGEWTAEALRVAVSFVAGASGGGLYLGGADGELLMTVAPNRDGSYSYNHTVAAPVDGALTFTFVSAKATGGVNVSAAYTATVYFDDTDPVIEITNSNGKPSGAWNGAAVTLTPDYDAGISGVYEMAYSIYEGGAWSAYSPIAAPYAKEIAIESASEHVRIVSVRYSIVTNTGKTATSDPFEVKIDDYVPTGTVVLSGTKCAGTEFADWYLTDVEASFNISAGESGAHLEYAYRANSAAAEWTEWVAVEGLSVTLTDVSVSAAKGGTDRYYRFRAVTGAGIAVTGGEYYIPIDLNEYDLTVVTKVAGATDVDKQTTYAEVFGSGAVLRRGDSASVSVKPNTGYYLKLFYSDVIGSTRTEFTLEDLQTEASAMISTRVANYVARGADIKVTAEYFKSVEVEYANLRQTLQSIAYGGIAEVTLAPTDPTFVQDFGTLTYVVRYNGAVSVPDDLGKYEVTATPSGRYADDFFISNATTYLTVSYFAGSGTNEDPYVVGSERDLRYIDIYMREDGTDGSDYLGANRKSAYFRQSGDIILSLGFKALGSGGSGYTNHFQGFYDGCGYSIAFADKYPLRSAFALFENISGGATIINLGVVAELVGNVSLSDASVALIAANAYSSGISSCYVKGEISVSGSNINVGGIVGYAENSRITNCFADVKISVADASGNVGGIAGLLSGTSYIADSYTIGGISVSGSEKYSPIAEVGTEFLYAGAVAGYCTASSFPSEGHATYYLNDNLSYDGFIDKGAALGNGKQYSNLSRLQYVENVIDFFAECNVELIRSEVASAVWTVANLTAVRINTVKEKYGITGDGTALKPFLVDSEAKLQIVEVLPWANYRQTADFAMSSGKTYSATVPFVGVYDGNGYEISGLDVRANDVRYGGLFGVVGGTIINLTIKNATLNYNAAGCTTYFGIAVGMLTEGATLENVVVSGTLTVTTTHHETLYAGAVAGVASGATVRDAVSLAAMDITARRAVTGGVVGQAQNGADLTYLVALTSLVLDYKILADVGTVLGAIRDTSTVSNLYFLREVSYAAGKTVRIGIGYTAINIDAPAMTYEEITTREDLLSSRRAISVVMQDHNPYLGDGTTESPFHIRNYRELLMVSSYMYASFVLDNDIVIGDLNGDGKLDAKDEYNYDFAPLGNGATFTGSFNGAYKSIIGLTDSLFAVNEGIVSKLYLSLNYKVYAYAQDIPASEKVVGKDGLTYTAAKVMATDDDLIFGAVAAEQRGGSIMRVQVTGNIDITLKGMGKAIVGGLVGKHSGGDVVACDMSASLKVRAAAVEAGGILGIIAGYKEPIYGEEENGKKPVIGYKPAVQGGRIEDNTMTMVGAIDIGGASIRAGIYIGSIKVRGVENPSFAITNAKLMVNGRMKVNDVDGSNTVYVGYNING